MFLRVIEKILKDIKGNTKIEDFQIKKELKSNKGKVLNDTIILEQTLLE